MYSRKAEIAAGVFVILGIVSLAYLSVTLGEVSIFGSPYYKIHATFDSITGLKKGAAVEIAGVPVGKVLDIKMENNQAKVAMGILKGVEVSEDTVASIRTKGLIGDMFVKLTPGGSSVMLKPGEELIETESAISLEELIGKYIFEKGPSGRK